MKPQVVGDSLGAGQPDGVGRQRTRGRCSANATGFYPASDDIKPGRRFVVYAGDTRYPVTEDVEAIGIRELATELLAAV